MKFGVLYDLRNPPQAAWHVPWPEFLAASFDHREEVDRIGFHSIHFTEHHGDPDGYSPAVIGAMTAAALRTKRAEIGSNIIVLPQHHPVQVADELTFVDIVSNGRLRPGFGPGGLFDMEYEMLGINPKHRPSRLEEATEIIQRALTEDEPFDYHGKRFDLKGVWINPKPARPLPIFVVVPFAEAAMERALRLGVDVGTASGMFFGVGDRERWVAWRDRWIEVCERHGKDPAAVYMTGFISLRVTDDPEKAWAEHRESHLYLADYERQGRRPYADRFGFGAGIAPEDLPGWDRVFLTPDQAVATFREVYSDNGPDELHLLWRRPSMSMEQSLEHLRLFKEQVEPRIRDIPNLAGHA